MSSTVVGWWLPKKRYLKPNFLGADLGRGKKWYFLPQNKIVGKKIRVLKNLKIQKPPSPKSFLGYAPETIRLEINAVVSAESVFRVYESMALTGSFCSCYELAYCAENRETF